MRKPFVKFITHSSSYMFFLGKDIYTYGNPFMKINSESRLMRLQGLLAAASQRFEYELLDWLGELLESEYIRDLLEEWERKERGALPGVVESVIIVYVMGMSVAGGCILNSQVLSNEHIRDYLKER